MKKRVYRWLGNITKHPQEQRNIISLGFSELIKSADLPLFSGTELQAFQVSGGLSNAQIGILGSVGQISMAVATFLSMWFADRVKNRVRANVLLTAGMMIYPIMMIVLSVGPMLVRKTSFMYPMMFAMESVEKLIMGMTGALYATLFARAISNDVRGRFTGIIGVVGGVIGMICGVISSWALRKWGYPHGFTISFAMAVGLLSIATYAVMHVKEIPELSNESRDAAPRTTGLSAEGAETGGEIAAVEAAPAQSPFANVVGILKMREFWLLAPPNILRGLGDGAGYFLMTVGMRKLGLGSEYAGYTTALIFLGSILGTTWIGFTVDRYGPGRVLFIAEALIASALVGLALCTGPIMFLVLFLLFQINSWVEGYTVPLAHYAIVPVAVIGGFSGIRLMMLYATGAVTTYLVGHLMHGAVGVLPLFVTCALIKLATGALYWNAFKRGRKQTVIEHDIEVNPIPDTE